MSKRHDCVSKCHDYADKCIHVINIRIALIEIIVVRIATNHCSIVLRNEKHAQFISQVDRLMWLQSELIYELSHSFI